ncbi:MAG: LptE family protein [Sphingobacteriaceae bacterium]|nr:LptE family protein [Sphingobacteriaceae bacterium]
MSTFKMRSLAVLMIATFIALSSCKPRISLSGASIPAEAKTVSVAFFTNNSSLAPPSLSQIFTEKLRDVVSQQTNLALMKQNGDLSFEGSIVDYNVAPVAIQASDKAGSNRLTIVVSVKYFNKFDETKNFDQAFSRFADYPSDASLSSKESELMQEINRQLTEDIFNKAFNNW